MQAIVREGVKYGVGGKYPAGSVVIVTADELAAFGDKLMVLPEQLQEQSPINATSAAETLAFDHGVQLSSVKGTGADGKITVGDVKKRINELTK